MIITFDILFVIVLIAMVSGVILYRVVVGLYHTDVEFVCALATVFLGVLGVLAVGWFLIASIPV